MILLEVPSPASPKIQGRYSTVDSTASAQVLNDGESGTE